MNLLEAIDARPELFALTMIIAFAAVNAWLIVLAVITHSTEERLARMRLLPSEDSSPGRARFGRSATTARGFSDTQGGA